MSELFMHYVDLYFTVNMLAK